MPTSKDCSPAPAWSAVWNALREQVASEIQEAAANYRLDPSALEKKVLLHLPRFSDLEILDPVVRREETGRLARLTAQLVAPHRNLAQGTRIESLNRTDFHVEEVPAELARIIHERFHYLGAERTGTHYGLFHRERPDLPAAFATVSELDVQHLRARLHAGKGAILSRMYAFRWAPRNSISAFLAAVSRDCDQVLFTYVNPNLGFTGSSYRAANWRPDGTKSITYRYANGSYVTARQAIQISREQLSYSQFEMQPLQIWRNDRE